MRRLYEFIWLGGEHVVGWIHQVGYATLGRQPKLRFLALRQGRREFLGMVDTGAEVSVIGSQILKRLKYEIIPGRSGVIRGVNGQREAIKRWVRIKMRLENGMEILVEAGEVETLSDVFILGLPLIEDKGMRLDFRNNLCHVAGSAVEMLVGERMSAVNAVEFAAQLPLEERRKLKGIVAEAHLSRSERRALRKLLWKHRNVWLGNRTGACDTVEHVVEVDTTRPIVMRPRKIPHDRQKVVDEEIDNMLKAGVIRPSKSPHAAEVVLVKKKDGKWRFCTDYRLLNEHTILDRYPLPRIQDLLRAVRDSTHFVALDLRSGYWQIPMAAASRRFTAFRTHRGLFEWLVMPFGLSNAPATFQRAMDALFADLRWNGVLVYLDDILVHGKSFEEVLAKLDEVLSRLDQAGFTLNLEKCNFFPRMMKYLGFILKDGAIYPDPGKVEAYNRITQPENASMVRSLLGHFGYYRQFIPNYSAIVKDLTALTQKGVRFVWTALCDIAVSLLKEKLVTAVLHNPLEGEEFKLETDASDHTLGAILSSRRNEESQWKPVEFASKTLSETEQRWPTHEKEAYAIVWGLDKFDQYLRGREFAVFTDNSSLQWMNNAVKGKVARWASRMAEYQMKLYHRSGVQMAHVDFLTRGIDAEAGLQDRMLFAVELADFDMKVILAEQAKGPRPIGAWYCVKDGVIYYRSRIWVPPILRNTVIHACHSVAPFLHPGAKKTKAAVERGFGWKGLHADVERFVRGCLSCQRTRPGTEQLQGLWKHHVMTEVLEKVYMDLWVCKVGNEDVVLLTMIDFTTKWAECAVLEDKTSRSIAKAFFSAWISRFGVPKVIYTDQEACFISEVLELVCARLGVKKIRTAKYHPQSNSPIETFHRTLSRGIQQFTLAGRQVPLREIIEYVLFAYRSTLHFGINESPAFLLYGVDMRPPQESDWRFTRDRAEKDRLAFLSRVRLETMARAHWLATDKHHTGRRDWKFEVGDLVLLRIPEKELALLARVEGSVKLLPKWTLPHRVVQVNQDGRVAVVKNLLTGQSRDISLNEVHIENARFIERPVGPIQVEEWNAVLSRELERTVFNKGVREDLMREFWERTEDAYDRRKRNRL